MQPEDGSNKALSMDKLCMELSARSGEEVDNTSLHHAMQAAFGDFASATTLKSLGLLDGVLEGGGTIIDAASTVSLHVGVAC